MNGKESKEIQIASNFGNGRAFCLTFSAFSTTTSTTKLLITFPSEKSKKFFK
jgi:hypothetical protein